MADLPSRHAVSRAQFFLRKAEACDLHERDDCEAYLEAAIVFARAALHRLEVAHRRHPEWKPWWDALLADPAVSFLRSERNWILKQGPPKVGQIIAVGGTHRRAADGYYYESPAIPAADTVKRCLHRTEQLILDAQTRFP